MKKTIAISSFKGGTAKTSTALHVGSALAKYHGQKVLLIEEKVFDFFVVAH
jgi:chromosome partitioning protein